MKSILLLTTLFFLTLASQAQENIFTLGGGYTSLKIDDENKNLEGWRYNTSYEFNPNQSPFAFGIVLGYAINSGISTFPDAIDVDVKTRIIPLYFQPKIILGSQTLQGFIKGALGAQFTRITTTAQFYETTTGSNGLLSGGGAGVIYNVNPNFFIQAEYEIIWMDNYYFQDALLNSAMVGFGLRF